MQYLCAASCEAYSLIEISIPHCKQVTEGVSSSIRIGSSLLWDSPKCTCTCASSSLRGSWSWHTGQVPSTPFRLAAIHHGRHNLSDVSPFLLHPSPWVSSTLTRLARCLVAGEAFMKCLLRWPAHLAQTVWARRLLSETCQGLFVHWARSLVVCMLHLQGVFAGGADVSRSDTLKARRTWRPLKSQAGAVQRMFLDSRYHIMYAKFQGRTSSTGCSMQALTLSNKTYGISLRLSRKKNPYSDLCCHNQITKVQEVLCPPCVASTFGCTGGIAGARKASKSVCCPWQAGLDRAARGAWEIWLERTSSQESISSFHVFHLHAPTCVGKELQAAKYWRRAWLLQCWVSTLATVRLVSSVHWSTSTTRSAHFSAWSDQIILHLF